MGPEPNKQVFIFPAGATLLAALDTANPHGAISSAMGDLRKEMEDVLSMFDKEEVDLSKWGDRLSEFEKEINGIVDREFPLARAAYRGLKDGDVGSIYEAGLLPRGRQDTIYVAKAWKDGEKGELLDWESVKPEKDENNKGKPVFAKISENTFKISEEKLSPIPFRYGY